MLGWFIIHLTVMKLIERGRFVNLVCSQTRTDHVGAPAGQLSFMVLVYKGAEMRWSA